MKLLMGLEPQDMAMAIASKLAVARYVRMNAPSEDWAGNGIRLNAICPGDHDSIAQEQYQRPCIWTCC